MSHLKIQVTVYLILLTFCFSSLAEAKRNQNREARQQIRITQGTSSGELTQREANRLNRGQQRVDHAQDKAMSDGVVSNKEKVKLEKMQDRQSKRIYRQKHDQQKSE